MFRIPQLGCDAIERNCKHHQLECYVIGNSGTHVSGIFWTLTDVCGIALLLTRMLLMS